ncbi:protein-tyrosine kinase 2-beta-like [Solea senegalensis]|nr:protein-tyrosine kinase 2-beta-like [Solea senegalensis]
MQVMKIAIIDPKLGLELDGQKASSKVMNLKYATTRVVLLLLRLNVRNRMYARTSATPGGATVVRGVVRISDDDIKLRNFSLSSYIVDQPHRLATITITITCKCAAGINTLKRGSTEVLWLMSKEMFTAQQPLPSLKPRGMISSLEASLQLQRLKVYSKMYKLLPLNCWSCVCEYAACFSSCMCFGEIHRMELKQDLKPDRSSSIPSLFFSGGADPPPKPSRLQGNTLPRVSHMQAAEKDCRPEWEKVQSQVEDTLQRQRKEMMLDKQWLEQEERQLDPVTNSQIKPPEKSPENGPPEKPPMPPPVTQPRPTAELDRSGDQVYTGVMVMVQQVVHLKNDVSTLSASEYPSAVKAVGVTLRNLIQSVDEILPSLHCSVTTEIEGTKKLLNKDLGELINKMRLAQQNSVTSLKEECQRQMLAAAHALALDSKNLLDAVDQARIRANLAKPRPDSQVAEDSGE